METKLIDGHNQFIFSEEEKDLIYDLFVNQGYSQRALMRKFGCSQKPMSRVLDEFGLDHSRGNLTSYKYYFPNGIYDSKYEEYIKNELLKMPSKEQKFNIDDHYFDDINNPNVVYTIGFLYADGCNHNCQSVSLTLEEGDGYLLEIINQNLQNEKDVKFLDKSGKHDFGYTYKNQYSLIINNRRIGEVLNTLGVKPRKSLTLEFPNWLNPSLYPHFIRGYFDGDGSLYRYIRNTNTSNTVVTITSTERFCQAICDIFAKYIGIKGHIYDASCHNGITKVLSLCGYDVCKQFLEWIYKDADLFLQRKYDRYCDYYNINSSLTA